MFLFQNTLEKNYKFRLKTHRKHFYDKRKLLVRLYNV